MSLKFTAMHANARIYVAGHRGLAGSALMRKLGVAGYANLITRTHAELDLTDLTRVREFFEQERPEYVFLAAAKVGGIMANHDFPAEFLQKNLAIQSNVMNEALRSSVKRLLFLGSSCIYPRDCPQPIREEYLLTGPLEYTNRPYAIAKIAGVEMCWSFNRQYATRFVAAMPNNLYGPGDNYDPYSSHVLPALIRKFHEAKSQGLDTVTLWGSGSPLREFLYSDDMADACLQLIGLPDRELDELLAPTGSEPQPPLVNIGSGVEMSISSLADEISQVIDYKGKIVWDARKPDGTPRKLLDIQRMNSLGWRPRTAFRQGLEQSYRDFLSRHGS